MPDSNFKAQNLSVSRAAVICTLAEEQASDSETEFYTELRDLFIENSPELADIVGDLTDGLEQAAGAKLLKAVLVTKRAMEYEMALSKHQKQ